MKKIILFLILFFLSAGSSYFVLQFVGNTDIDSDKETISNRYRNSDMPPLKDDGNEYDIERSISEQKDIDDKIIEKPGIVIDKDLLYRKIIIPRFEPEKEFSASNTVAAEIAERNVSSTEKAATSTEGMAFLATTTDSTAATTTKNVEPFFVDSADDDGLLATSTTVDPIVQ